MSGVYLQDLLQTITPASPTSPSHLNLEALLLAADRAQTTQLATNHARASAFLQNLPRISFSGLPSSDQSCGICLENYATDSSMTVVKLPCHHNFHATCISRWLSPSKSPPHNSCPFCRKTLFKIDTTWPSRTEILERVERLRLGRQRRRERDVEAEAGSV